MAAKKPKPAMAFLLAELKKNPSATYAECAAAATTKKLKLWPVMFGRAQALLGIVEQAPRGQGKAAKAKTAKTAKTAKAAKVTKAVATDGVVKRGPGRRRKNAAAPTTGLGGSLDLILATVKSAEQERLRYRRAVERIQQMVSEALGR